MSRQGQARIRDIAPDPKFHDRTVTKFVNVVMERGKKAVAEQILYGALDLVAERTKEDGLVVFKRALDNVISISYDRDIPGEDARAMECHDTLLERLTAAGYFPNRRGVQAKNKQPRGASTHERVVHSIKHTLDPNGILAPGRYEL